MKKKIILIGAGGHAKSCIDVIESEGKFKIVGLIDNLKKIGTKISGYEVIGKDKELEKFKNLANYAFITIGQIKSPNLREKSFNTLKKYGFEIPYICSPKSIISKHSIIAEGVIVHHGAIINSGTEIGRNCIINTNSLIEHNCKIGEFSHISTSVVINGDTVIGKRTFVGSGSIIKNSIKISGNSIIPMGSRIFKDI